MTLQFSQKHADEVRARAFEAISSLTRTLGTTMDVQEVARRALLTVSGQFLAQRSAFYLWDDESTEFHLCEALGIRPQNLRDRRLVLPTEAADRIQTSNVLARVTPEMGLPPDLGSKFQHVAEVSNGTDRVGLLFLGAVVRPRDFDEADLQLLQALGMIIGTTVARSIAYQRLVASKFELENAARIRKDILDHVSHEFNTPLMVMRSAVDMLESADEAERADLLSMMTQAQARLEYLVRSILHMSKDEEPVDLRPVDLDNLVRLVEMGAGSVDSAGGSLRVSSLVSEGFGVEVDEPRILSIVEALVSNAWKFQGRNEAPRWVVVNCTLASKAWWERQPHEERIRWYADAVDAQTSDLSCGLQLVDTDPVPTPDLASDPCVIVEVIDPGNGIAEQEQELIFEAFAQASNSTTRGISGAGMGLPAARSAAGAMGAELVVASEVGAGSIFALILPARRL